MNVKILSSVNIEIIDYYGVQKCINILNKNSSINAQKIDIQNICDLTNNNTDVFIIAGGEPRRIRLELKGIGAQTIRKFISNGGGYVGICAGAVLAIPKAPSLDLLQYVKSVNDNIWWDSGICGDIKLKSCIKNTDDITNTNNMITTITNRFNDTELFSYKNGPLLCIKKTGKKSIPIPIPLATFSLPIYNTNCVISDALLNEINGSVAIIFGTYNKGSIIITSIHPEYNTDDSNIKLLEEMCYAVISTKNQKNQRTQRNQRNQKKEIINIIHLSFLK